MILRPGLSVAVTLTDKSTLSGTSGWSWRTLRLRNVSSAGNEGVAAKFLIPASSVLAVQIL